MGLPHYDLVLFGCGIITLILILIIGIMHIEGFMMF
jgi:hypothetical protein